MRTARGNDSPRGETAVLFSGGRDSTASAIVLHNSGHNTHLLSFCTGLALSDGLRDYRVRELGLVMSAERTRFVEIDVRGLVRMICFVDLVKDIQQDGCQLILLGEMLSMATAAIRYSREVGCSAIALGATSYQSHFPEQRPECLKLLESLANEFGIDLLLPGIGWDSEEAPKDILRMSGVSTKSLESVSLLSDIHDNQPLEAVLAYAQRKLPICRTYLGRALSEWDGALSTS